MSAPRIPAFQEGRHILLVGLYSRLVERIESEDIGAYSTGILKELEKTSEVIGTEFFNAYLKLGYSSVYVSQFCTQLGHCVAMLYMLTCKIVELVKVLGIASYDNASVALLYANNRFEEYPLTFLDELTHGMEIGREIDRGREDSFQFLSSASQIKPFLKPAKQFS